MNITELNGLTNYATDRLLNAYQLKLLLLEREKTHFKTAKKKKKSL